MCTPDESIVAIISITLIAIVGIVMIPDGAGKDIALSVCGGIVGYLTRAAKTP